MRQEDRERALTDVQHRVVEACVFRAENAGPPLDEVLAESIFQEKKRLREESKGRSHGMDQDFWRNVQDAFHRSNERTQRDLLGRIVRHYAEEVVGNFNDRVYQSVTRALPPALGLLLNAASPKRLLSRLPHLPPIEDAVIVQGHIEELRRLHEIGTVIMVPTHVSNLDSIVVGYAIYRMRLPPFVYGAGLNLFENPMLGYFMHNLGAYTVDRKKRDPLYKEVLKSYAAVTLELGYDNIFFPGGTRSRSGALEKHLKLGLMGTGIEAYVANLQKKKPSPRLFIVPATLSMQLVLEAETLIDDFLKEVGQSRYIITDDEFSKPKLVFDFISKLFSLDSKIYFTIGRGMDPFGNPVDEAGNSLDPLGRVVDPRDYVLKDGEPVLDAARDAEYTREVGERVSEAFARDNQVQATNVVARAAFGLLREKNPSTELLRLIRAGGRYETLELMALHDKVRILHEQLQKLEAAGKVRLDPVMKRGQVEDIVADGLRHFAIFHAQPAVSRQGDQVLVPDRSVAFYYQNRLEGYGLWPEPELPPALSHDRRRLGGRA